MQKGKIYTVAGLGLVLASIAIIPANARQTTSPKNFPTPSTGQTSPSSRIPDFDNKYDPADTGRMQMEQQAAKARNNERFKRIQADTDRLLKLSTELKSEVDKTTKTEMSLDVIRKAAEVEKLAHDVKERMKG